MKKLEVKSFDDMTKEEFMKTFFKLIGCAREGIKLDQQTDEFEKAQLAYSLEEYRQHMIEQFNEKPSAPETEPSQDLIDPSDAIIGLTPDEPRIDEATSDYVANLSPEQDNGDKEAIA